jgi:hypothetical protein
MARVEERRAASHFYNPTPSPVRPLGAKELHAKLSPKLDRAQPQAGRKELSFGAGRSSPRTEPDKTPASGPERKKGLDDALARRAAQMKDRDTGFSR